MTLIFKSVTYPTTIDTYYHPSVRDLAAGTGYMIDFVDIVYGNAIDTLAETILAIEVKLGETGGDATGFGSVALVVGGASPNLTVYMTAAYFNYVNNLGAGKAVMYHPDKTGLTGVDEHTQYPLLLGRAGGQTLIGGTASGDDLTIQSTSHATRGEVMLEASSELRALDGFRLTGEIPASNADYDGEYKSCTTNEIMTEGKITYINASGSYESAIASDFSKFPCVAMTVGATTVGASYPLLFRGLIRFTAWSWTIGGMLYVSAVSGDMTQTPPAVSGQFVQPVGYAVTADTIYFNPMIYWHEVA